VSDANKKQVAGTHYQRDNRMQHFFVNFKQGQASTLHHALHEQALDQTVRQSTRYGSSFHGTMCKGSINKNGLEHPRNANEIDDISLGDGASKCSEALSNR
jgi:hypothetical protein